MPDTGDLVHRNEFKLQKLGERRGREAKQMRSESLVPEDDSEPEHSRARRLLSAFFMGMAHLR
jgi:hypothetical protein